MSINSVVAGPPPTVTHNGKVWTFSYPTQKAKANLVAIITENAKSAIRDLKPYTPPEEYIADWNAVMSRITGRHFHTWHPGWMEAMGGQDGEVLFLLALLRLAHPEATEEDARTLRSEVPEEVAAAYAEVMPGFFDLLEKDFPPQVPKSQRERMFAVLRQSLSKPSGSSSDSTG